MTRPPEQIRLISNEPNLSMHATYMVEFEHDWPLVSALIERWMPESHTFHLPCGEMTITLQDVAYQLGLRIDGDPVSGCIGGSGQHHQGRTIEFCEQILGVVHGLEDRKSQTKWTVKLTWFHNTVCGRILFPDASDYRVHIKWLPLLEDFGTCGRLSWGSAVLAWLYRQICHATEHDQCNLHGWVQYQPNNVRGESRLRHYKRTLNGIGMLNIHHRSFDSSSNSSTQQTIIDTICSRSSATQLNEEHE
ncbi:hypothetical protein AHAS_Ahas13G0205600 [Arachis hypogaea]